MSFQAEITLLSKKHFRAKEWSRLFSYLLDETELISLTFKEILFRENSVFRTATPNIPIRFSLQFKLLPAKYRQICWVWSDAHPGGLSSHMFLMVLTYDLINLKEQELYKGRKELYLEVKENSIKRHFLRFKRCYISRQVLKTGKPHSVTSAFPPAYRGMGSASHPQTTWPVVLLF